jgi:membrane protein YqaA with SNARE-associated domain
LDKLNIFKLFKRLYDWVLHWAETPYAMPALFLLAFCESSFFPVPPDVLLIALAISIPKRSFRYALACSVASVLGGALGYLIGLKFMELIGIPILEFYGYMDQFIRLKELFQAYDFWVVGMAGFTPIPYKVFTIASGACTIDFLRFMLASFVSRSARFFLVATLIYFFGEPIKGFIDKYFNLLSVLFFVLIVLGFVVIKYLV